MNKQEILGIFQDALKKPLSAHLEQWISEGGKAVGHYCTLIPDEIFTAAGMAPYRIRGGGSEATDVADVYLSSHLCTFARHTANLALEGQFDFLSGIVGANGCDQARRAYDVWKNKTKVPFRMIISVPRRPDENSIGWYKEELQSLIAALEMHFSIKIAVEDLRKAVQLHNAIRRNLAALNGLRKAANPPIAGAEAVAVAIAAQVMPPESYNKLLEELLNALRDSQGMNKYRVRLIVSGGEMDEPEFVKAIEDQGGLVVYEDTCFGGRYYEELVSEDGDPLTRIAERYFYRMPCARTDDSFPRRYENLKKQMKEFGAKGIVVQRINHCILNAGHSFLFSQKAKEDGTPILIIDREYLAHGYGQVKTRVQAFIESIESRS
jgi:benzoyl-CoA reductase/2-hydroxyglutaryl-CoA dehydratase subunit BcrC/BadD/HgdB